MSERDENTSSSETREPKREPQPRGAHGDSIPAHDLTPEQQKELGERVVNMSRTVGGLERATDSRAMAPDDPRRKENRPAATVLPTNPLPTPTDAPAVGAPTRGPGTGTARGTGSTGPTGTTR
jgi:hypothetical protein